MSWLQLVVVSAPDTAENIEQALQEAGAAAITLLDAADDPILEPAPNSTPLWPRVRIQALFADDASGRLQAEAVAARLASQLATAPRLELLPEQPWERMWLAHCRPQLFGQRLWICPQGQPCPAEQGIVVELDPGLAFGTGDHPTTALCLSWLDGQSLAGKTVIDYGCGSGILAIAALKLGAAHAIAIDHDPQALEATHANAAANQVATRLEVLAPGASIPPAAIVVANILARPLLDLAADLATLCSEQIALSGLLNHQGAAVAAAYAPYFDLDPPISREDWLLLSGRRYSA